MSGTEGQEPAGSDPIDLQFPGGAAGSGSLQNVNAISNTFDRHKEFVAGNSISWRQGKFCWLEMIVPDYSACKQQTSL